MWADSKDSKLTGIKANLIGGVMLKAEQWDIGAVVEYILKVQVTILAGYYSSLKMVLWLVSSLFWVVGCSSTEQLATACAARTWCGMFMSPSFWASWSHFSVELSGSCDGKWYGSWKQCFRERLQLASNSTCSYVEINTFYLGMYQGKQTDSGSWEENYICSQAILCADWEPLPWDRVCGWG